VTVPWGKENMLSAGAAGGSPDPELRCYPADDLEFLSCVRAALAGGVNAELTSRRRAELVRAELAVRYPLVRIVPRHPLAGLGSESGDLWYCYRDGSLIPSAGD
jgi:hypothetical protein